MNSPWGHETSIRKRFSFSVSKLSVLRQSPANSRAAIARLSLYGALLPNSLLANAQSNPRCPLLHWHSGWRPPWTSSALLWASVSTAWPLSAADLNVSEMPTGSFTWPRAFLCLDSSFLSTVSERTKLIQSFAYSVASWLFPGLGSCE